MLTNSRHILAVTLVLSAYLLGAALAKGFNANGEKDNGKRK